MQNVKKHREESITTEYVSFFIILLKDTLTKTK
jgi:hypothetical protein